jgi:integrase
MDKIVDKITWDERLSGFGQRQQGERRSWIIQYRLPSGQQRRLKIGDAGKLNPDKAFKAAKKKLAQVELGQDPAAEKKQAREDYRFTFRSVANDHLDSVKPQLRKKTYIEKQRYLQGAYFKALHSRPIGKIERREIAAAVSAIARTSGAIAATRARSVLSGLFGWAVGEGICELNPVIGTNKPAKSKARERVLTDQELVAIWKAAPASDYGAILKLLILSGCRRQEIGGLRWSEIDHDTRTIKIPADRSKNHRPHEVALSELAWSLLPTQIDDDRAFVFGRSDSANGFGGWAFCKEVLNEALGDAFEPWTVHDIRRTVATRMADLGVFPHVVEAALNHQSGHKGGIAGIYNKSRYEREVRTALALWSDHVRALVEDGERRIIPLRA